MRKIFYFCNVKSNERYIAAASKQRFLCPNILVNSKRKEWANGNVPKVSARLNLTVPTALSLLSKFKRV
jgi:hypothetical protein